MIFPFMRPHERARLDRYKCRGSKNPVNDNRLFLTLHGRIFRPIASIDLNNTSPVEVKTSLHTISCNGMDLSIDMQQKQGGRS